MVFKDMDVSMIALKPDKNVSNVELKVERVERTPDIPAPSGIPYVYIDIKVENAGGAKIDGRVEFKVGKSWISANNIEEATVELNRYEGGEWKALPTSKTGEDNATVHFGAETLGFSLFAVTGEKKMVVEAAATSAPTVAAPTPAATPTPTSGVSGFEASLPELSLILVIFFAFVSLLVAGLFVVRKIRKGKR